MPREPGHSARMEGTRKEGPVNSLMTNNSRALRLTIITACFLFVGGCAVGPKHHPPATMTPAATNYKESPVSFQNTEEWKVADPQDGMLRGNWWEVFNEPELNSLEEQLNINNETLKEYFSKPHGSPLTHSSGARAVMAYDNRKPVRVLLKVLDQPG